MAKSAYPALSDQRGFWETWNLTVRDPGDLNEWCIRRADVMLRYLQGLDLRDPAILDLGCGTGWFSEMLATFGTVTGVDLAEGVIARAKARGANVDFMAGDIFQMSLPENHFDVVVSQEVIAHVPDQAAYLEKAADVLRRDGYLIITTPNKFVVDRGDFFPPQPPEHVEKWLTIRQMRSLLRKRFRVLRSTTIIPMGHRGILRVINSPKVNAVLAGLSSREHIGALKERLGLGYILVTVAQKRD